MKKFICTVCGYVHEGDAPPEFCPVCKASSSKFEEMKGEMTWADEHRVGCGGINFADDKTVGKISWDIIHPDYQGKSLGKQLLEYRIDKLKSIDRVRKITVRTSQLVYKFYQKQGFVLKATHKDYWAKGIDWSMKEIRTPLYFKM